MGLFGKSSAEKAQELANEQAERTNEMNYKIHQEDISAQRNLSEYQNAWNAQQWDYTFNKENEYNSYKSQLERAKAAGLNPAMMNFGDGNNTTSPVSGSTSSVPTGPAMQSPQIVQPQYRSALDEMSQYLGQMADIWNKRQQIEQSKQAVSTGIAQENYLRSQSAMMDFNLLSGQQKLPYELNLLDQQGQEVSSRTVLNRLSYPSVKLKAAEMAQNISSMAASERLTLGQLGNLDKLTSAQIHNLMSNAYSAIQSGNWSKFQTDFAKQHGFPLQNSDWLNRLMTSAMENPEQAQTYVKNFISAIDKATKQGVKSFGEMVKRNLVPNFDKDTIPKYSGYPFGFDIPLTFFLNALPRSSSRNPLFH